MQKISNDQLSQTLEEVRNDGSVHLEQTAQILMKALMVFIRILKICKKMLL